MFPRRDICILFILIILCCLFIIESQAQKYYPFIPSIMSIPNIPIMPSTQGYNWIMPIGTSYQGDISEDTSSQIDPWTMLSVMSGYSNGFGYPFFGSNLQNPGWGYTNGFGYPWPLMSQINGYSPFMNSSIFSGTPSGSEEMQIVAVSGDRCIIVPDGDKCDSVYHAMTYGITGTILPYNEVDFKGVKLVMVMTDYGIPYLAAYYCNGDN